MNIKDLDFFQIKLLNRKEGIFYVRDGKIFAYQGNVKYEMDVNQVKYGKADPKEKVSVEDTGYPLDPTKGITIKGFFWVWQDEEYFVLSFIDKTKKHNPILITAGNALQRL